jgi:hypothetical protein
MYENNEVKVRKDGDKVVIELSADYLVKAFNDNKNNKGVYSIIETDIDKNHFVDDVVDWLANKYITKKVITPIEFLFDELFTLMTVGIEGFEPDYIKRFSDDDPNEDTEEVIIDYSKK